MIDGFINMDILRQKRNICLESVTSNLLYTPLTVSIIPAFPKSSNCSLERILVDLQLLEEKLFSTPHRPRPSISPRTLSLLENYLEIYDTPPCRLSLSVPCAFTDSVTFQTLD